VTAVAARAGAPGRAAGEPPGLQPGLPGPEQLHPALWRAHQVGQQRGVVQPSGFAELDAQLPGGGWPARALTELLLPHPGIGELRLLAPALAAVQQGGRSVMLFDPPAALCGWALAALGLDLRHLVLVQGRAGLKGPARALLPSADVLWALEQALKSGHVGAALAWLPARVRPEAVRRLQLAAQGHDGPAFLLRDVSQQARPSAAPLRLLLAPAGPDELALRIVKRRGPPLMQPLVLSLVPVLSAPARARALRDVMMPVAADALQSAATEHP
jgi:protein ImuA